LAGALAIVQVGDKTFERLFGLLMVVLLVPILWPRASSARPRRRWSPLVSFLAFTGIGFYGGAFQAGVGIFLIIALSYAGHSLVRANSIKVVVNAAQTAVALPVFIAHRQVAWVPALVLAVGFGLGGAVGARLAVRGGEAVIRPVLAIAVVALAGRMMGL